MRSHCEPSIERRVRRAQLAKAVLAATLIVVSLVGPAVRPAQSESEVERLWRQRASGFEIGRIEPGPTLGVIEACERDLQSRPNDLDVRFRLLEALYFQGYFLTPDAAEQRRIYERMVDLAEQTLTLAAANGTCAEPPPVDESPRDCGERVRGHFWTAISWGLWGMSHSRLQAGARGVASKIRDHAQGVVDLDTEFADAGGLRLLGRLHTATPKIVFFTGWIDRDLGIDLLERANRISTADPRNPLFLAEALLRFRPQERERAIGLLKDVAGREPDPARLVEETETIEQARQLVTAETER